jgi:hypothetical protein
MIDRDIPAARVLDAFPTGRYGLLALLRILDIEPSEKVETAAIECVAVPRMLINPAFVEAVANTPEKLMMLVMHELHHVLLGHTRLFPRATPAQNLVFDAVINAMLCRMFPESGYTALFTEFYSDERFPECLLRPPERWVPDQTTPTPPGLENKRFKSLQPVYRALYSETGADYYELFQNLCSVLPEAQVMPRLLGRHDGELEKLDESGALFDAVRAIVETWPQPPNPIAGRSWSELLGSERVQLHGYSPDAAVLTKLLRRVARTGPVRRRGAGESEAVAPSFKPDRRSIVLGALGCPSLLHRTSVSSSRVRSRSELVHVYVDVSGSVWQWRSALFDAVVACRSLVFPEIHEFSTEVVDVPLTRFRDGECQTTNGTDIHCVAAHMRKHRIRRAVVLTDGAVGKATGDDASTLRACVLGVALTRFGHIRRDLQPYADFFTELRGDS